MTTAKQSVFPLQIHGERERIREEERFESVRSCARTSSAQYHSSIPRSLHSFCSNIAHVCNTTKTTSILQPRITYVHQKQTHYTVP